MELSQNRESDFGPPYPDELVKRPLFLAMFRGAAGRCPACGQGRLFARYLATQEQCPHCHTVLSHHRADDLPAYLNIMVIGHIVVGAMMLLMTLELFGIWTVAAATILIAFASSVALMRPLKGAVIGAQWALLMHGFGGHDD
jgi:uncharacterized protein (DUF983 family)